MKMCMLLLEIRSGLPGFTGYYSEGVAAIASVVKQAGYEFELIHITRPTDAKCVAMQVARSAPDLIGMSCMSHTFSWVRRYAPVIKAMLPDVPILLGGVHAILNPDESIDVDGLDAICLGEGEVVVPALLAHLGRGENFERLHGLWVKSEGVVHRNPAAPVVEDLDSLPIPDRGVFDFKRLVSTREGVLYIFASRGCPYPCPFCCNRAIMAAAPNANKFLRYKSVARVCQELDEAMRRFPGKLRGLYFQDEILTMNRPWFEEFAEVYPKRIGLPFNCNLRADLVNPEVVEQLVQAGCNSVSIGLESGVERIRREVVGKNIRDAEFEQAYRLLQNAGIRVNTFSMVGLPGETPADSLATVFMNGTPLVDKPMISIFCPYPGTKMWDSCKAAGILSDRVPETYQEFSPLNQETISARQVEFIHDYFSVLVALRRRAWPGRALEQPLLAWVQRDGLSLVLLSRMMRVVRWALAAPYLYIGRHLFNRQARVFKSREARPRRAAAALVSQSD